MKKKYDVIVIGGGHNGLVAAACLAQAGKRVLVLEKRDVLGGAAATEESWPGFRVNIGANDAGMFQDEIVRALFLKMNGLEFRESPVAVFAPRLDGDGLTLWRDVDRSVAEIGRFSSRDAERYPAFVQQVNSMTAVLRQMLLQTPPDLRGPDLNDLFSWGNIGLRLRRLGKKEMMAFLRLLPMSATEYLNEWFECEQLKGILSADAITGMMQGPRSAGTTLMFLYQHINGFMARRTVLGGMGGLSQALANVARQNKADIRTGADVARIQLDENGRVIAVLLQNGDQIPTQAVLSSVDPRQTLFDLVGPQQLPPRFMRQVRNIIYRGSTARMNLALKELPAFAGQTNEEQLHGRILISPSLAYLEKAYDEAKYGRFSTNPYLEIVIPSLTDKTLAPEGQHIMCITMKYAPYHLRQSTWPQQQDELAQTIMATLTPFAPDLKASVLHQQLITPLAFEQVHGLTKGSIHHGQMGLDHLLVMRPVPGWGQYQTPIDNLFLCGAGTHPGGGVTGAPGFNAAREILAKQVF